MSEKRSIDAFAKAYHLDRSIFFEAKKHYTPLPYHNWEEHVMDVLGNCLVLTKRCERYNVSINRRIVGLSAVYHDAEYAKPHMDLGFRSKEALSASVLKTDMLKKPYASLVSSEEVLHASDAILSTEVNANPLSIEAKVLRAGDLMGLIREYDIFIRNSLKIKEETQYLTKTSVSNQAFALQVATLLTAFLAQDIRLTPEHDQDGFSVFHKRTIENLHRFLKEYMHN